MERKSPKTSQTYRLAARPPSARRGPPHTIGAGLSAVPPEERSVSANFAKNREEFEVSAGSSVKITVRVSGSHLAELERRVRRGHGTHIATLAGELLERAIDGDEDQDEARVRRRQGDGPCEGVDEIHATVTGLHDFVIRQEKATETLSALIVYSAMRLQEVASNGQRSKEELKSAAYAEARRFLGQGSSLTSNVPSSSSVGTEDGKKKP